MRSVDSDQARVPDLSGVLAPLAFAVGAFTLLFDGLKLLLSNWRLTLVQIHPAIWIWAAMLDLKEHVLHEASFEVLRGPA